MRSPNYTTQFERDLRLLQRRGKDIGKLKQVLAALINEEPLAEHYRDHPLKGNYQPLILGFKKTTGGLTTASFRRALGVRHRSRLLGAPAIPNCGTISPQESVCRSMSCTTPN